MMCRELQKQNLMRKKRPYAVVSLPLKEYNFIFVNIEKKGKKLTIKISFFWIKCVSYWG